MLSPLHLRAPYVPAGLLKRAIKGLGSIREVHFQPGTVLRPICLNTQHASFGHFGFLMANDAAIFRRYAAMCRSLAEEASDKDKGMLMEIAAAWDACAEEQEQREQNTESRLSKPS